MKKTLLSVSALTVLAACATQEPEQVGMPNPASQYCIDQGGELDIQKDANGNEYGMCHLPDGRVIEEWALFRSRGQ